MAMKERLLAASYLGLSGLSSLFGQGAKPVPTAEQIASCGEVQNRITIMKDIDEIRRRGWDNVKPRMGDEELNLYYRKAKEKCDGLGETADKVAWDIMGPDKERACNDELRGANVRRDVTNIADNRELKRSEMYPASVRALELCVKNKILPPDTMEKIFGKPSVKANTPNNTRDPNAGKNGLTPEAIKKIARDLKLGDNPADRYLFCGALQHEASIYKLDNEQPPTNFAARVSGCNRLGYTPDYYSGRQ